MSSSNLTPATALSSQGALPDRGTLVVTGGSRGIGAEIARAAARGGRPVAIIYRSKGDAAGEVVREIAAGGGRAIAIAADVGCEADVVHAFDETDRVFGPIGGLVNNAVLPNDPVRIADLRLEDLERVFRTNVFGGFLCAREAVKRLSTKYGGRGGAIVTMSSSVAINTGGPGVYVPFSASKGALETMSRGLAKEVAAEGVRVNVVRCGVIETETRLTQPADYLANARAQIPMRRMGTVGEAAAAVLWLLSAEASYVTGAVLEVAGGI